MVGGTGDDAYWVDNVGDVAFVLAPIVTLVVPFGVMPSTMPSSAVQSLRMSSRIAAVSSTGLSIVLRIE